jgi:hypothetical protein
MGGETITLPPLTSLGKEKNQENTKQKVNRETLGRISELCENSVGIRFPPGEDFILNE